MRYNSSIVDGFVPHTARVNLGIVGEAVKEYLRHEEEAAHRLEEVMIEVYRNVQRFRGGLVFKALRLVYHSTLGLRVIQKKKKRKRRKNLRHEAANRLEEAMIEVQGYLAHKKQRPPRTLQWEYA